MVRTVRLTRFGSIARAMLSTRVSPPAKCKSETTESTFSARSELARDTWGRDFIYYSREEEALASQSVTHWEQSPVLPRRLCALKHILVGLDASQLQVLAPPRTNGPAGRRQRGDRAIY